MSFNVPKINKVVKVLDPRLDISAERAYACVKGAQTNSWQAFNGTNLNNSSVQINMNPPSNRILISRMMLKRFVFLITVTGTNTGAPLPLLKDGFHGPRAFPLCAVTSAESISINNDVITANPQNQYMPALLRYHNDVRTRSGLNSVTPSMLDQFDSYENTATMGSNRNPLGFFGSNPNEDTRADYVGYKFVSDTGTVATYRLTVIEPIMMSPLAFGDESFYTSGLIGVENMSYTCTFANLSRLLSLSPTQGVSGTVLIPSTGIVANLESAAILVNYLTPDPLEPVPKNLVSSYFSIVSYPTKSSVPVPPNGKVSIPLASIQLGSIPQKLYYFAREDDSVLTAFSSDTFLTLDTETNPLQLTWNANQYLSQASAADLYLMSRKNGCDLTYSQFTEYVGSVGCLNFGTDIGLASDECAGVLSNNQLALTASFVNRTGRTLNNGVTLYCVVVYEGTFNINESMGASHQLGVLSKNDVLNSKKDPEVTYRLSQSIYGGDFFKGLKKLATKAHDYVKKHNLVSKIASQIPIPQAQNIARIAKMHGYGKSGGKVKARKLRGGNLTKEELKKRLESNDEQDNQSDDCSE